MRRKLASPRRGPLDGIGPAVRACLAAGICDAPEPLEPGSLDSEADEIVGEGLAPVALKLVDRTHDPADAAIRERLREVALEMQIRSLTSDAFTGPVLAELARQGVQLTVIKGPAVARFYPSGWSRPYTDLDLLVPRTQFAQAVTVARSMAFDYPTEATPPWPWFDSLCREGVNLHGRANIDVHHNLPPWIFGARLDPEEVIAGADAGSLHGVPVRFANAKHSLVISALHILNDLWKGKRGLTSWRDLLVLLESAGSIEASAVFEDLGLGWLHQLELEELASALPWAGFHAHTRAARPTLGVRTRLRVLGWGKDAVVTRHRMAWAARLPFSNAIAFAIGTTVPSASYIRVRHGSYRHYWRQAWSETVSTFRGADYRTPHPNHDA